MDYKMELGIVKRMRTARYKDFARQYWDYQYQSVGWRTVHDSGGMEATEKVAEKEMSLFLFPEESKVQALSNDPENPFVTFTPDFHLHPEIPYDAMEGVALDFGCGGLARYTAAMADYFRLVFGVDISPDGIAMGKARLAGRKVENAFLRVCDGIRLDFPDEFFSFIFSNLVLQHIGNKEVNLFLAMEFGRCLKPGGMMRLEYLDGSQKKPDGFESPVEGNGITADELAPAFEAVECKIVCATEKHPWFWVTVTKEK